MRRDRGAARLAPLVAPLGVVLTAGLVAIALALPAASGAPPPAIPDLVVLAGLGAGAAWLTASRHVGTAAMLGAAALVWTATGVATSLPAPLDENVARLVLVPHALVVVAMAMDRPLRSALAVPLAGVAAVAAGSGVDMPVLALLGVAVLVGVDTRRGLGAPVTMVAVGCGIVALDPQVLGARLVPRDLALAVDVLLLAAAALVVSSSVADPLRRLSDTLPDPARDDVGAWLGAVLGEPRLSVAFPSDDGPIDVAGHPVVCPPDVGPVHHDGEVVALVHPVVRVEPAVREPLGATLRRLGEVARLRAECRDRATEIIASRGRFQAAADEESTRLERQLDGTVMARLDGIEELLRTSPAPMIAARVEEVRTELRRHARGLDPLAGRSFGEALDPYRARGVRIELGDLEVLDGARARTAWYVVTEGITNAVKHAAGSGTRVVVDMEKGVLEVVVSDEGPGGADPDGAGLQGLADRVAAAGGTLRIASGAAGTSLSCTLPAIAGHPVHASRENADPLPAGRP